MQVGHHLSTPPSRCWPPPSGNQLRWRFARGPDPRVLPHDPAITLKTSGCFVQISRERRHVSFQIALRLRPRELFLRRRPNKAMAQSEWMSAEMARTARPAAKASKGSATSEPAAISFDLPLGTMPMEARSAETLPEADGWQYEPKWDGFRCLAFKSSDEVRGRYPSHGQGQAPSHCRL